MEYSAFLVICVTSIWFPELQCHPDVSANTNFQPIVGPRLSLLSAKSKSITESRKFLTTTAIPTALSLVRSKSKTIVNSHLKAPIKYEDNTYSESKRNIQKVVRYTKKREPSVATSMKEPVKQFQYASHNNRPRRGPKPSADPSNILSPNPLNEFSLAGDIYDPAQYRPLNSRVRSASREKGSSALVFAGTDADKLYGQSVPSSNSIKTSYKPFGTSLLSPSSLLSGVSDLRLEDADHVQTNLDSSSTYPTSMSNFNYNTFQTYPVPPQTFSSHMKITFDETFSPKKPLPLSTSYGDPLAPSLNSYAIDASKNSYHIPLDSGKTLQVAERPMEEWSYSRSPTSTFGEPPFPLGVSSESALAAFDAPYQFHVQQTKSRKMSALIAKSKINQVQFKDDDSITESNTFAQTDRPSIFEQEEFGVLAKHRKKNSRKPNRNSESNESSIRDIRKQPASKGPSSSLEDNDDYDYEEAPDDDYLDEIVSRKITKRPLYREKKRHKASSPHILDTDDLRDAFFSGSAEYSLHPDNLSDPKLGHKSYVSNLSPFKFNDDMIAPQIRASQRPLRRADRFLMTSRHYETTEYTPFLNDYNSTNNLQGEQLSSDKKAVLTSNNKIKGSPTGIQYKSGVSSNELIYQQARIHSRADVSLTTQAEHFDEGIITVNEKVIKEFPRAPAPSEEKTSGTTLTTLWDGETLPKNHKLT